MSADQDGVYRADLPADVAFDTFFKVYRMFFVRGEGDGFRRTALCAFGAPDACIGNFVPDKRKAFAGWAPPMQMSFVFLTKIVKRG
jgi:hypothetical protein